jgi:prepilin-type N-terminal cleavage/methylation domain-containing protein
MAFLSKSNTDPSVVDAFRSLWMIVKQQKGFTLLEISLVLGVVGILSAFAIVAYGKYLEKTDITSIKSFQSALQTTLTRAKDLEELPPLALIARDPKKLARAVNLDEDTLISYKGNNEYLLTLNSTGRKATFRINSTGDVKLMAMDGFTQFVLCEGGNICEGNPKDDKKGDDK